ncbi:MAG: hypothetical protein ACK4PK_10495 [Alphaproteobacteria bacterium]
MSKEQRDIKGIASWIIQMTPEASLDEIYKVARTSPELDNIDKPSILEAIHCVLKDRKQQDKGSISEMKKPKEKAKESISGRKNYVYKKYRIISGFKDDQYLANAYTDNGSRLIASLSGSDEPSVTQEIKIHIDQHIKDLQKRRDDHGVPSAPEYGEAFECLKDSASKQVARVIKFHAEKNNSLVCIKDLIYDLDCTSLEEADMLCTKMARQLSSYTGFKPEAKNLPAKLKVFEAVAVPVETRSEELWVWSVRPQVVEALKSARI